MITIKKALMLGVAMMVSAGAFAPLGAAVTWPRMTVGGWFTAPETGKVTIAGELACYTTDLTRQDQNLTLSYTVAGTKVTATLREVTGITCSSRDATLDDGGSLEFQGAATCTRTSGGATSTEPATLTMEGTLFDGTGGGKPSGEKGFDFVDVRMFTPESETPTILASLCEGGFTGVLTGGTMTFHGEMPQASPED